MKMSIPMKNFLSGRTCSDRKEETMSIPLSERTIEIQVTDVCDDALDDRIAFLLAGIMSRLSAEETENLISENTEQNT